MDWEDKDDIQKGKFIGKIVAICSIFYTSVIFFLVKTYGEIYMSPFSPLALLTFPTGYILFFLQGEAVLSCTSSEICLILPFIISSIITWIILIYLGFFIGRRIEKSKPREQRGPSPHNFDWRNVQ